MVNVITISGKARHGKDTFAKMLKSILESKDKKVLILRYADYLKMICKDYFGWNGEKDEAGRTLLQQVGTNKIRAKDPDFWVKIVNELITVLEDDFDYFIIPDTRFPNEISYLKTHDKKVVTVKVIRDNFESELTKEQKNHPSETALDDYKFDIIVRASNLRELEDNAGRIVRNFKSLTLIKHNI